MNEKYSRSMNKACHILAFLLLALHCMAQDYETFLDTQIFAGSENINWIRTPDADYSYAELSTAYTDGSFRSPFNGRSLWSSTAKAKSLKQFQNFSIQGTFSFSSASANGACGSMSAISEYYPVDIYEFTPGKKSRQVYDLLGGLSLNVSENWLIGGKFTYQGQNYTKFKDLRHTTYHMSLQVSPSVLYRGDAWSAGGVYSFRRNTQSIVAEEIGINSGVYYAFLDKGLFYGVKDIWDNSSVHLKESGLDRFPIQENMHSLTVQSLYDNLFAEFGIQAGKGKIGEKQKIWYDYDRYACTAALAYRLTGEAVEHTFKLKYDYRFLKNYENILEDITQGGITTTYDYGSLPILSKSSSLAGLEYMFYDRNNGTIITADASITGERAESSTIYPYVYSSELLSANMGLSARFAVQKHLEITALLRAQKGFQNETSRSVSDTQASTSAQRATDIYSEMTLWKTSLKIPVHVGFRYTFDKGLYAKYGFTFVGHKNGQITNTLAIGYNF